MRTRKLTIGVAAPAMSAAYSYFTPTLVRGYDRDEGLDLAFFFGGEPRATASALCSGACDIACLNTVVGFMGRDQDLPMIAVGSKARRAHRYFAVPPQSPIGKLSDLRGKRMACDFPHIQPLAEAALAEEGVSKTEFAWTPWVGSGMEIREMVEPLANGDVDALFLMDWTIGDAAARGVELRHLASKLLDRIRVSSCYWTTESRLGANAEILARALRAIHKSLVFSFANPEAAIEAMWETHPQTRSTAGKRDLLLRQQLEVLKACLEPMRIDHRDPDPRWCAIPAEEMRAWRAFLLRSGALRREPDLDRIYTTALVETVNDFDAATIRAEARFSARQSAGGHA